MDVNFLEKVLNDFFVKKLDFRLWYCMGCGIVWWSNFFCHRLSQACHEMWNSMEFCFINSHYALPSVLWRCWLGVRKSDGVLAWLSDWSEVQMICIWSSWCHCHPISCFTKIQIGLTFLLPAYPGCRRKEAVNGCLSVYSHYVFMSLLSQPIIIFCYHHLWYWSLLLTAELVLQLLQAEHSCVTWVI